MMTLRTGLGLSLAMVVALVAAASAAAAEAPPLPPGNSAVTQYTEPFPTARGERDAHDRKGGDRSPREVLGSRNAKLLRERGPAGNATAELAAETAPVVLAEDPSGGEEAEGEAAPPPRGGGGGASSGGGPAGGAGDAGAAAPAATGVEGSSGLAETIARATGTSSPQGMGVLLPLLMLATVFWAFAYLARRREADAR